MIEGLATLWGIGRQQQLESQANEAASAKYDARKAVADVDELERRVDALTLTCQALWELTQGQLKLTDRQLLAKIQEIDLRDGKADGKITLTTGVCPKCKQRTSAARRRCVYCGTQLLGGAVFRKTH